ncbi:hypothetical protein TNCT_724451 [Trichonephila clavata]|uniref:Uncharacterized protein n=1 Tax=Trichonephila clavata TaxID=2740835 RepID=A0A8X6GAC3_TRICU|nr:hypothetical protein TNCT_724451 [Trichonephila clavata]
MTIPIVQHCQDDILKVRDSFGPLAEVACYQVHSFCPGLTSPAEMPTFASPRREPRQDLVSAAKHSSTPLAPQYRDCTLGFARVVLLSLFRDLLDVHTIDMRFALSRLRRNGFGCARAAL